MWGARPAGFAHIEMQESTAGSRLSSTRRLLKDDASAPPLGGPLKRAFDIAVASIALVALMPLILLSAILVRQLTSEPNLLRDA